jgi:hypothetical protein
MTLLRVCFPIAIIFLVDACFAKFINAPVLHVSTCRWDKDGLDKLLQQLLGLAYPAIAVVKVQCTNICPPNLYLCISCIFVLCNFLGVSLSLMMLLLSALQLFNSALSRQQSTFLRAF